jgi:hypothetical protein
METGHFRRLVCHAISAVMSILPLLLVPNPARAQAALTAFWTGNQEVVAYAAYGGGLNILYYNNGWHEVAATQGYPIGSPLASYYWTAGGLGEIFFACIRNPNSPSEIVDLCNLSGSLNNWTLTDLTTTLNAAEGPSGWADPFSNTVTIGTQLTGFSDSGGTSHIFYVGNNSGDIHEMYGNNRGLVDPVQFDHTIGAPQVTSATTLNSLWDGNVEHVYYITGGDFWETYYNGAWWSYAHSTSGQDVPQDTIVSAFVGNAQKLQNIWGPSSNPSGDITRWVFDRSGDSCYYPGNAGWCFAGSYSGSPAPVAASAFINFTGANGNFNFYTVPGQNSLTDGLSVAWSGIATYQPPPLKQAAGFFDGIYNHVFWVGGDSNIHEAYGTGTNPGTWYVHAITNDGSAQN